MSKYFYSMSSCQARSCQQEEDVYRFYNQLGLLYSNQEKSHATMQVMDGFVHVWCLGRSSKRE
jgi:hypothetical protein